ncbi:hypothetical protein ZEAMMB73_Zm00001d005983 [Zea mays]|nr:hypothetical protein ZEAMMB73_Zm00001d005983 [Zea mays]ONM22491.1 hypothetical protein ZEAMMB73_Zm00001d005983 [Zea mays]
MSPRGCTRARFAF